MDLPLTSYKDKSILSVTCRSEIKVLTQHLLFEGSYDLCHLPIKWAVIYTDIQTDILVLLD